MPTTLASLTTLKDLLGITNSDTSWDAQLNTFWDMEVEQLARETDAFVSTVTLSATALQAVYTTSSAVTRVVSVFHNEKALGHADTVSQQLGNRLWSGQTEGTPHVWLQGSLPPDVNASAAASLTPRSFAVVPPPAVSGTGSTGFMLIVSAPPPTIPVWLEPYVIYRVATRFIEGNSEWRDSALASFYEQLAALWLQALRSNLQV